MCLIVDKITFLAFGMLFFLADWIINFLYDVRYQDASWILQMLSISVLFLSYTLAGQCFLAIGKSRYITYILSFRVIALFIIIPIVYEYYGLKGAILVIALNPIISAIGNLLLMKKENLLQIKNEFKNVYFVAIGMMVGYVINISIPK